MRCLRDVSGVPPVMIKIRHALTKSRSVPFFHFRHEGGEMRLPGEKRVGGTEGRSEASIRCEMEGRVILVAAAKDASGRFYRDRNKGFAVHSKGKVRKPADFAENMPFVFGHSLSR